MKNLTFKSKFRFGIDGRAMSGELTGTGRYIFELCRGLDEYFPNAEFIVFSQHPVKKPVVSPRWIYKDEKGTFFRKVKSIVWLKTIGTIRICSERLDFFWAGTTTLPLFLRDGVISISTIHDFVFRLFPETMATHTLLAFRIFHRIDLARSEILFANSQGTANKLNRFYGRKVNSVIQPGVSLLATNESHERPRDMRIQAPYILSVATIEPRKNLHVLFEAYSQLKKSCAVPHQLVIVGKIGWKEKEIMGLMGETEGTVHLGHVSDSELAALYANADIFVFPSLYEGFGMPVQEARVFGVPIIATDSEEIREAGDTSVKYIKPTVENLKEAIWDILERGIKPTSVPNFFTWRDSAKRFAEGIINYTSIKK